MSKQPKPIFKKGKRIDSQFLKRFDKALEKYKKETDHLKRSIENAERLSEKDFAIRINTKV